MVVPVSAWLTGQLALASSAAEVKAASSRPGTVPSTVRWMPVMPVPGWKVTSAEVVSRVGGVPAPVRPCDRAMEKQLECAAAISSSGLVLPFASSARDGQDTACSPMPEESKVTVPEPSVSEPSQTVCAERVVATMQFPSVRFRDRNLRGHHPITLRMKTGRAGRSGRPEVFERGAQVRVGRYEQVVSTQAPKVPPRCGNTPVAGALWLE
uniref:Uncharacterized protein n=1 Tax=Streptomyces kanamyceticus TaxID=1967 RepID=Q1EQT9_STRKN|nr:hypothetical protein [Streptomyces kanamyceticus]